MGRFGPFGVVAVPLRKTLTLTSEDPEFKSYTNKITTFNINARFFLDKTVLRTMPATTSQLIAQKEGILTQKHS